MRPGPDFRDEQPPQGILGRLVQDERGVITRFVVKLALVFALLSVAANEAGQVLLAQVHASNAAATAALTGANVLKRSNSQVAARREAADAVTQSDVKADLISITFDKEGTASATVEETADTLLVHRISFLRHFGEQLSTEISGPAGP
jgi:Flp pilus assembly protein TadG